MSDNNEQADVPEVHVIAIEISRAGMNVKTPPGMTADTVDMWLHRASVFMQSMLITGQVEKMLDRRKETEMMRRMVEGR